MEICIAEVISSLGCTSSSSTCSVIGSKATNILAIVQDIYIIIAPNSMASSRETNVVAILSNM